VATDTDIVNHANTVLREFRALEKAEAKLNKPPIPRDREADVAKLYLDTAQRQIGNTLGIKPQAKNRRRYAELLLIGSLLLYGSGAEFAAISGLRPEHFQDKNLGALYQKLVDLQGTFSELEKLHPNVKALLKLINFWFQVEKAMWDLEIQAWYTESPDRALFSTPAHIVIRALANYVKRQRK